MALLKKKEETLLLFGFETKAKIDVFNTLT